MPVKNIKVFSLENNTGRSVDPVRNSLQSYWIYDGSELIYDTRNLYNTSEKGGTTRYLNFEFTDKTIRRETTTLDTDTQLQLTTHIETLEITPNYKDPKSRATEESSRGGDLINPEDQFDAYIENSIIPSLDEVRPDYKISLDAPMEYASEVDNNSVIAGTVNYAYNYGLGSYENEISTSGVSESDLSNFYTFSPVVPLPGATSPALGPTVITPVGKPKLTKRVVSNDLLRSATAPNQIQDFFMNSEGFLESLELQEKKDSFPFYNEVYFTNPPDKLDDDKIKIALRESGLIISFCDLMNKENVKFSSDTSSSSAIQDFSFANSYLSSSYEDGSQQSFVEKPALQNTSVRLYDGMEMLKMMQGAIPTTIVTGGRAGEATTPRGTRILRKKGFLTDGESADYRLGVISKKKPVSNAVINFENALDDVSDAINELLSNTKNYRTYKEILAGTKPLYMSDVLFYRIAKFEEGSDTAIQNFWIPSEKGYRGIRYIDTQVKYGKAYRYEIYAFKFVIGSEYKFIQDKIGVVDFSEDLANFVKRNEQNIENLTGIAMIRPAIEQAAATFTDSIPPALGLSIDVDSVAASAVLDFIEERDIIAEDVSKASVDSTSGAAIATFAKSIDLAGSAMWAGNPISKDILTPEELQNLQNIASSWDCLTNASGTNPGKLADLEIQLNRIIAIGNIEEKIIAALQKRAVKKEKIQKFWKSFGIAIGSALAIIGTGGAALGGIAVAYGAGAALLAGSLATVAAGVSTIVGAALGGKSKRINSTGLDVNDLTFKDLKKLFADIDTLRSDATAPLKRKDGQYLSDLFFPKTFEYDDDYTREENALYYLPLFSWDSSEVTGGTATELSDSMADYREKKAYELELVQSILKLQVNKFVNTVNDYLGCYADFINAASETKIVLDYKRINKYTLTVETAPTIKFAQLPYYVSEGRILDNPPIYPNVNVVTYRGIADKMSFFMNSGQGAIEMEPITFAEAEDEFIAQFRKAKKLNDFQPILYKSDETENLGTIFEIRRLSAPPINYQSFKDATVSTTTKTISSGKNLPAATFDDIIESNVKYYYIFRVADRRGIFSYPSHVVEIEMIENSGIIYALINPYEFPKPKGDTLKTLKRLLNVVPRITQVFPSRGTSFSGLTSGETTVLGSEAEKLFGKQFKLRLTSKKTGKTVDLNLSFKANVVERSAEVE